MAPKKPKVKKKGTTRLKVKANQNYVSFSKPFPSTATRDDVFVAPRDFCIFIMVPVFLSE